MSDPIPKKIEAHLVESDDFLGIYALRHRWTPFEAACLIAGYQPGPRGNDASFVGVVELGILDQQRVDEFDANMDRQRDVIERVRLLGESLADRWPDEERLVASEVIEWALGKGILSDSSFVHAVLGRAQTSDHTREIERLKEEIAVLKSKLTSQPDGRGKHFEQKRMQIVGETIRELAINLGDDKIEGLLRGGQVNASALARHLHKYRSELDMPSEDTPGFSFRNIETTLREVLKANEGISTDKS